ncbi:Nuclear pore complex protein NUP54-like protein [Drosera capensis]
MFGAASSSASPSLFGTPSTPTFGSTSLFGTPASSTPAFGATPSPSPFATPSFGFGSFNTTPFSQQQQQPQQQKQQTPSFLPSGGGGGGFGFGFGTPQPQPQQQQQQFTTTTTPFNVQVTTQMAPVAPLPLSLAERDIQAIVDAYKDEAGNPKYAFKYLLFSVTEPQLKGKPVGVSDIMWAEAMGKLEGMDSLNRERLWPQLVQGFKDLSQRLKLQDEVLASDAERLRMTQSNVKMLQRHLQADTLPRIERLRQKEHGLQRLLLRIMRIVEALEGKGSRLPLMKGEVELAERLAAITRQLKGSGELSRRVQNLLAVSRVQADANGGSISLYLSSSKIHERSLSDMHENRWFTIPPANLFNCSLIMLPAMQQVLQQQTEAIARLGNVLKRDVRDVDIIMA